MTATPALHILIVDDNTICAQLLARIFELEQLKRITTFEITIHHSPEDALPDLGKNKYDIIFTDIEMNGMSGCDMAKAICDKSADSLYRGNCDSLIIAVTSKYDSKSLIQYEEAGIITCLRKPAKKEDVLKIIEERVEQLTTSM